MARLVVTGGTGTLGRSLIRHALASGMWDAVRSVSRDEQKAAALDAEFSGAGPFKAMLGDVRDHHAMKFAFRGATAVVHAAALKRVDVGAYSPGELIKTNIDGTVNVVDAAIECNVGRVVVISSDKACAPCNIYGASKYCAETYAVQANSHSRDTRIAAVRYGNVLGSRGSVFHIWRDQLRRNEALTLTSREMTRFVMSIEQAVEAIEMALLSMTGGEVFIPILKAATMEALAVAVTLHVSGVGVDNAIMNGLNVIGLRPGGEKLAESLLNEEEPTRTVYADHRVKDWGQYLAVLPTHHEWRDKPWDGRHVPDNYSYRSDNVPQYTLTELRDLIANTEACK